MKIFFEGLLLFVIVLFSGVQLSLGIIGEYVLRIYY
jgi:hypothetical protein